MEDIRKKKPNEGPILNFNKRHFSTVAKQEIWHTRRNVFKTLKK